MKIKEVSEKYNISEATIRYYERIGLLPSVPRNSNGVRIFDKTSCEWIEFIKCMRSAGIQIKSLCKYIKLFDQEGTAEKRKEILLKERKRMQKQIDTMNLIIKRLDKKIAHYQEFIITKENK